MAEAKLYGQNKGGMSINGIIKDYYAYAGENISAGDLVEFINGVASNTVIGTTTDIQLSTQSYSGAKTVAIALDDNRVFIAHSYGSNYNLYGMVVTIDGINITYGVDTLIGNYDYAGDYFAAILLKNGNIFIAHARTSKCYLSAVICSVNGNEITVGNNYTINNISDSARYSLGAVQLSDSQVCVLHSGGSSYVLAGITVDINGITVVNHYSDKTLSTNDYTGRTIKTQLLPNGNIFVATSYSSNYYLYGMILHVSGSSLVVDTEVTLAKTSYAGYSISTCILPDGNVFIAHSDSLNYYLNGMIVNIDGTTITAGTDTRISSEDGAGLVSSSTLLANNKIFIAHMNNSGGNSYNLDGVVVSISDNTVVSYTNTKLNNTAQTGRGISTVLLANGPILVVHNYGTSYLLYAQIWGIDEENNIPINNISIANYETQVRKVTTGQFDGIAQTSGVGGDNTSHNEMVSIWTLAEGSKQIITVDGKKFADSNGDIFLTKAILPVAYTKAEYIESSKAQYIDTNHYVKYGDVITVDMAFLDTQSYFGYYSSSTNRVGVGVAKGAFEIIGGTNSNKMTPISDTERHTFVIDTTGKLRFDNESATVTPVATDFIAAYSFTLFGRKQSATNVSYKGQHRIYGFTINNNEELIMNLVPCRRNVDGVYGLYDTVSKAFFANSGTGKFTGA